MFNPDTSPDVSRFLGSLETAAQSLKIAPIAAPVHSEVEIETAIIAPGREPGGGLVVIRKSAAGLTSTATRSALGTSSCSSASRLATNFAAKTFTPVALPPGRARAASRPASVAPGFPTYRHCTPVRLSRCGCSCSPAHVIEFHRQ
jgi:hypothetical protein